MIARSRRISIPIVMRIAVCCTLTLLCSALIIAGCDAGGNDAAPVLHAEQNDPEINAAIERARAELGTFEAAFNAPKPTQTKFGVKVALPHAGGVEHIWLAEPRMEIDSVLGIVEQTPAYATQAKRGDLVRINRSAISDWMFLEDGSLRGGYTMRVAIERLPESERDEQRRAIVLQE